MDSVFKNHTIKSVGIINIGHLVKKKVWINFKPIFLVFQAGLKFLTTTEHVHIQDEIPWSEWVEN